MKICIVPIGNSKGIRIPKPILQQCHIKTMVNLMVEGDHIIITPDKETPRKGWGLAFKKMAQNKDDKLLISDSLDIGDWVW